MKNFIAFALILVFPFLTQAQTFDKPDRGAVIRMNNYSHELKAGTSATLEVWLIKSKRDEKRTFGNLVASQPNGIKVNFEAQEGGLYTMNIETDSSVKPGNYMLIIKGSDQNAHKVRNTTFSLVVQGNKTGLAAH